MIKYQIIQYTRSTFQLGLQARNVNKSGKITPTYRTALFISKPVKFQKEGERERKGEKEREREKKEEKREREGEKEREIEKMRERERKREKKREREKV